MRCPKARMAWPWAISTRMSMRSRGLHGWTVGDGRYLVEGVEGRGRGCSTMPMSGTTPIRSASSGWSFPPNRAALADCRGGAGPSGPPSGDGTDHLHPRLCGGFLQMIPMGAVVERLAVFLAAADAPDQMAQVLLRALVADPAFAAPPAKLRRPFEFWRRSIAPRGPRSRGRRTAGTGS